MIKLAFVVVVAAMLAACSTTQHSSAVQPVMLSSTESLRLSAPPEPLWGTSQTRLLSGTFDNKSRQLIVQTEFSQHQIAMVALLPSGVPVMEVVWHAGKPLSATTYFPVKNLTPSYIIADLQLALWPQHQLASQLSDNASLVEQAATGNQPRTRHVKTGADLAVTITYNRDSTVISHLDKGYEIRLSPLE